jgi:hypothetical protein
MVGCGDGFGGERKWAKGFERASFFFSPFSDIASYFLAAFFLGKKRDGLKRGLKTN